MNILLQIPFFQKKKFNQETAKFEISPKITTTASNMKVCLRLFFLKKFIV